ncbi:DNA methylase N-4/N-6 [Sutcliffiella cohnii]|uniref:DNA methylase N-4/N-6 n=1 Tax=Sutcliffiella cohnii TaxID=33932 RepID=UPI00082C8CA7|nr:DNA methylase N-4/N-6 [Sutcliffiella cohnii]
MLNSSIHSTPNRGPWGKSSWRGNCSGYIIKDLIEHFKPSKFVEVFGGSGTGYDVAQSLNLNNSVHLDLNPSFGQSFSHESELVCGKYGGHNLLIHNIPGADFIFSHPPYHNIIKYSGEQWGEKGKGHPDDLSRCESYEDFIKKLNFINGKIFSSLNNGGRHATLLGDVRSNGKYYSIIKDMAYFGELESHIIKVQHNLYKTENKEYSSKLIRIHHEHLLIFKKNQIWQIPITAVKKVFKDLRASKIPTWRDLVQSAVEDLGGIATLNQLYSVLENSEKAKNNPNWQAKIRQTLQIHREFRSIQRGVWGLNLSYTAA